MLFDDIKELADFTKIDCICKPIYMHMDIHMHVCMCAFVLRSLRKSNSPVLW